MQIKEEVNKKVIAKVANFSYLEIAKISQVISQTGHSARLQYYILPLIKSLMSGKKFPDANVVILNFSAIWLLAERRVFCLFRVVPMNEQEYFS